jgi:hypothetical protein
VPTTLVPLLLILGTGVDAKEGARVHTSYFPCLLQGRVYVWGKMQGLSPQERGPGGLDVYEDQILPREVFEVQMCQVSSCVVCGP